MPTPPGKPASIRARIRRDPQATAAANTPRAAKRAINQRDFETAKRSLKNALRLDDRSAEGFNLAGVVAELSGDFRIAARYYEQALRLNKDFAPAQQNAKRIHELAQRGTSNQPIALAAD